MKNKNKKLKIKTVDDVLEGIIYKETLDNVICDYIKYKGYLYVTIKLPDELTYYWNGTKEDFYNLTSDDIIKTVENDYNDDDQIYIINKMLELKDCIEIVNTQTRGI